MTGRMLRALAIAAVLTLAGCSATRPLTSPQPWDKHGGEVLPVRGASPGSPGQVIYRTLRDDPSLRRTLDRQGEPDTLEVQGGRLSPKTIILRYTRPSIGTPQVIVLAPSGDGFVVRGPVAIGPSHAVRRRASRGRPSVPPETGAGTSEPVEREENGAVREDGHRRNGGAARDGDGARDGGAVRASDRVPDAGDGGGSVERRSRSPQPSAEQALGCPIDPSRPDCQAFCTPGADHEWCGR